MTSTTPTRPRPAQARHRAPDKSRQPIVVTPPRRFQLPSAAELWQAREVFVSLGRRDITLRYRQTALGVVWVVLQPLLAAGIFTLVFGKVAGLPSGGVPYFVFSFAGMMAWNMVSGILSRAAPSLVTSQALVSRVFFPRIMVPLSTACSALVDFVVTAVMLVVLLIVYRVNPGWPVVLTPVWLIAALMLSAGIGSACAAVMVKYRDVQYIVPVVVQLMLYVTPIAYSVNAVPAKYRIFVNVNPFAWIMQEFHWSLLGTAPPPTWQIVGSVIVGGVVFLAGTAIFERMERGMADYI